VKTTRFTFTSRFATLAVGGLCLAEVYARAQVTVTSFSPANGATGVCYDTPLNLTFNQAPTRGTTGKIRIYNVTNGATPVDTVDLSLNAGNGTQARTIGGETFNTYPVIITGNTAAIYPHLGMLTSNQVYYVTVDASAFSFVGITATNAWQFSTKAGGPVYPQSLVVAADGSGDFQTVQGAVDSVSTNNTTPTIITVRNGNYVEIVNVNGRNNLTFRGQSREGVMIGYANNAGIAAAGGRMAVKISANDIVFDNLTLTNRYGYNPFAQSEALSVSQGSLRFMFLNCTAASFIDTLFFGGSPQAQAYFNNCLIIGQSDYVWGIGVAFFTNCELHTIAGSGFWSPVATRTVNGTNGLWPAYNGLYSSNGFSFVNCTFTRGSGVGSVPLAGNNGTANGVAAWINCSMSSGYTTPQSGALSTELLWAYGNTLNGSANSFGMTALTSNDPRLLAAQSVTNWLYGWQPMVTVVTNHLLASSLNPSTTGSNVTFTATIQTNFVTAGNATGLMVFKDSGTALSTNAVSGGVAAFSTNTLAVGSHSLTAEYSGGGDYLASTSAPLAQVVQAVTRAATTTALSIAPSPSAVGSNVLFTATVRTNSRTAGDAGGSMVFKEGTSALGTAPVSAGVAVLNLSSLTYGSHLIKAEYSGDPSYLAATSSPLTQIVQNPAATTTLLSAAPNPSVTGSNVIFAATVQVGGAAATAARGTMVFKDGATALSTNAVSGGVASYATTALACGSHLMQAEYGGYGPYQASTSAPVTQIVQAALPDTPTNLTWSVSGGSLMLSWPGDYLGWILQAQTNSPGLGTNWADIPGTTLVTSTNLPLVRSNPFVLYRLRYP